MKKILATMAFALALPVMAYASAAPAVMDNIDPFTGVFVGLGVGFNAQFIHHTYGRSIEAFSLNSNTYGANFNAEGGYNFKLSSQWLLGADVHAQYNTASYATTWQELGTTSAGLTDTKTKLQWQYGLAVKLGYSPFARNMFYVLAGPEWAELKHRSIAPLNSDTFSRYQFGGAVGLGVSQNLMNHLDLSEQVTYDFFSTKVVNFTSPTAQAHYTMRDAQATVFLEYHF